MKKMTFFLIILISISGFGQRKISSEKIFELQVPEEKKSDILQVSSYGYLILSEGDDFYLLDKNREYEKVHLYSKKGKTPRERMGERAKFSTNDRYLCISKFEGNRKTLEIYDTISKKSKEIETEIGNVVNASVLDMDNIIYQVRTKGQEAKVFLIKNGGQPTFITDGIGERWSPDGKKFIVKESRPSLDDPKRRINTVFVSIFNSSGQKLMETSEFGIVNWVRWSPTSDKIVLYKGGNFYIIYLNEVDGKLFIEKKYHFKGFEHKEGKYYSAGYPKFSPSGSKISFKRIIEDGHRVLDEDVWILEDGSYDYYSIADFDNAHIKYFTWTISGNVLVVIQKDINLELIRINLGDLK